jgi:hypothetical protein
LVPLAAAFEGGKIDPIYFRCPLPNGQGILTTVANAQCLLAC